ncbi:DUF6314 family protein [Brachybacterium halotolerans subsp. kimchii]|uniref:DUF6314 family protein n=1 Tax=Brachybacterium halotolerans TaxID=2795215 RepID=UPI001E2F7C51|nr:DUF6314 family protein [Brachybacterium halotolerans]UEJ83044.1 DUF6314 family protein [Brachybacterium halotolerans subsp. kimchii]
MSDPRHDLRPTPRTSPGASPLALLGDWLLNRRIEDRLSREILQVTGTTEISMREDGRIVWSESGVLVRGAADARPIPVRRELLIERRARPLDGQRGAASPDEDWMVLFADGRDFHPWTPGRAVVHPCGEDRYDGLVEIRDEREWHVTWEVTGPAKDMTIRSVLTAPQA